MLKYSLFSDEFFMNEALKEAQKGLEENEIPVGAVIIIDNQIIARTYNQTEKLNDFTAHAEMLAITAASESLGSKYLHDCTLYVTLEPCVMCAGAAAWSQLTRIVYGAPDPKKGFSLYMPPVFPKKTKIIPGVLMEEAEELLLKFFKGKR